MQEHSPDSRRKLPINIIEIMDLIPHRYPFLLVDRVIDYTPHKELTAIKNVSFNESFFAGHFVGYPIMPGVLIIEGMAQSAGLLNHLSHNVIHGQDDTMPFFASIEKAKFKNKVIPGDTITFKITVLSSKATCLKAKAIALVEDKIVAEAVILLMKVKK